MSKKKVKVSLGHTINNTTFVFMLALLHDPFLARIFLK